MENNQPTNNFDFDFTLIANFFKGLDRQGPGGDDQTQRALSFVAEYLPRNVPVRVADVGCGTGRQTAVLARSLDCRITAVDLLPAMIEGLQSRILHEKLSDCVTPLLGSMESMPFADESLDLIWAEGSIYHIGYERGLTEWRRMIRRGGFVALTECCWLSDRRPDSLKWFTDNFTEIDTVAAKTATMQRAGYDPIAHFILPSRCWTENYYHPMQARMKPFLAENPDNPTAEMLVKQLETEIGQYRRWGDLYGYVFFVGRRR